MVLEHVCVVHDFNFKLKSAVLNDNNTTGATLQTISL